MSYATWDCETTTRTTFKRKASAFCAENWVVTHGFKKKGQDKVTEYRFGTRRPGPGWLRPVLDGVRLLCGFNIKFDLLHALQDEENLELWMGYVAGGGMIWDCQLAEYLLCGMGQADQILSLDEVAPRYGGNVKIDEVKALWAAGVSTEDIDPDLLSRYLCGGPDEHGVWQKGDVENTEAIALAQIKLARERNQLASIMLNMGSLLCSIEMERNGMFVDKPLGLALADELSKQIAELRATLLAYLPTDLPFEFNWNSTRQRSAMLFGGTVQWDGHEYDIDDPIFAAAWGTGDKVYKHVYDALDYASRPRLVYSQKDETHYVLEDGTTMECLWYEHCWATEWAGEAPEGKEAVRFAGGKNAGERKTKKVKVNNIEKPKGRAVKVPYTFTGVTKAKKSWESTAEPGVYSTSSDVIEELGNRNIPFLKALSAMTAAVKDLGTYFIVVDENGNEKGMLSLVDAWGIIHHSINHTATVTARFSSSNPNLYH